MDIVQAVKVLQDPMGVPFFPQVFQILMVVTFALHIIFVNFVVGGSFFAIYGTLKGGEYWARLSRSMVKATAINPLYSNTYRYCSSVIRSSNL